MFTTPGIPSAARHLQAIRRAFNRLTNRLTRNAKIRLDITISLPPFVRLVFDYQAELGLANDNQRVHKPKNSA